MTAQSTTESLTVVNDDARFPRVRLAEPVSSGFVHIAAEVDGKPPFLPNSRRKRLLLARCKEWCRQLESKPDVLSAVVFDALVIPPGRGEFLKTRTGKVHLARFDLAVLIETTSPEAGDALRASPVYAGMGRAVREAASFTHVATATNPKSMGPVNHESQGVFLFNYFFADDTARNLAVWEYTVGWFAQETGLDNSTVLLPRDGEPSECDTMNHRRRSRRNRPRGVMPSLLFKRSLRATYSPTSRPAGWRGRLSCTGWHSMSLLLALPSPERALCERATSCRWVRRVPLPIFARYPGSSSGVPASPSGALAGAGGVAPESTAFFSSTRLLLRSYSAFREYLMSFRRRPMLLLTSQARADARSEPRRSRQSRSFFARRFRSASRIISSRRCFHTSKVPKSTISLLFAVRQKRTALLAFSC